MSELDSKTLYDELVDLSVSDYYPFHMPGHKRKTLGFVDPYGIDITEIGGFDNLAHPTGLIKNIEDRLASLYRTDRAYAIVNGSTAGNLSMIYAANRRNANILVARNCHKSVIHAIELKGLKADYIYPDIDEYGIQMAINPDVVRAYLKEKKYDSFIMTSPTYEGICSNIEEIASICHEYDVTLLVDAAHGAHMGITDDFPANPIQLGADCVSVSLHKTLPSFTQTAAILVSKESRIDRDELEDAIRIFQSSSPSYILMAGIDKAIGFADLNRQAFYKQVELVRDFRDRALELKNLVVVKYDDMEESKIVILSKKEGFTGEDLLVNLREKYHLELEMASGQYALAMTTIMDDKSCLTRLFESLKAIDKAIDGHRDYIFSKDKGLNIKSRPEKVLEIYEVKDRQKEKVSLDESEGRISYNEVCVYPPGVADLLPGEKILKDMIEYIKNNIDNGFEVEGIDSNSIYVLREF